MQQNDPTTPGYPFFVLTCHKQLGKFWLSNSTFSVKEKQPMQHSKGGLALILTRPAKLLVEAAFLAIFQLLIPHTAKCITGILLCRVKHIEELSDVYHHEG